MEEDNIYRIYLIEPISISDITQEKLDEDFTEELYQNITPEEISQNKVAIIGDDVFYIRCDVDKIKKIKKFIKKYHIIEISDVSIDIIKSNEIYNSINKEDMDQFGQLFDDYRLTYTTKDDVLDKILKHDIDYIDDIDKKILGEDLENL